MQSAEELIERAKSAAKLDNFGDESFREGLERLVRALDAEAGLNAVGAGAMEAQFVGLLTQRLQIEDWYGRHPEIDDEEIVAPLIGLGMPRTGSTALAFLLAADPAARSLRTWESLNPCPPPETATQHTDPRIAMAEASMERRARLFPRMTVMLPSTATGPTECQTFMALDFKSQLLHAFAHAPSYVAWLNNVADLEPTYRYVKRVLKLLQWRCPPNKWRLKNPSHTLFIDALNRVFPDARFVMTHREITAVVPSTSDVYYELRKAYADNVDMKALGEETAAFCEEGMRRMIAFRDAGNEHRFFDIHFAPFQADPFPALEKLYAFMGETLSPEARAGMAAWREATPRAEHYERTDMAAFGFSPEALKRRFQFYAERFPAP